MGMTIQTRVRVRHPTRGRIVEVSPEQAAILRQVRRVIASYKSSEPERRRLLKQGWKQKTSLWDELEMFDLEVAGAASWCEGSRKHPDPRKVIRNMNAFDVDGFKRRLRNYPALTPYVQELANLRQLVTQYLEQQI